MDKKSEKEIEIYQDKKYIKVKGNDFTYIICRIDGEYFKIDSMLDMSDDYRFVPNRDQFLEAMKYDAELRKTSGAYKVPVVLHSEICTHTSELSDMRHLMNLRQAKIV